VTTPVAVITGGSRGIGRATCLEAARRGYDVVLGYSTSATKASAVVAEVRDLGPQALAVQGDLRTLADLGDLAAAATDLGPVALLVNNAGVTNSSAFEDMTREGWDGAVAINLTAPAWLSKELASELTRNRGAIVNVSSQAALLGSMHSVPYGATKAGVLGLTKTLAGMLAPHVRVNAVCPGPVATEMLDTLTPELEEEVLAATPAHRIADPWEIARVVLDVASWTYCTGQTVVVDGGRAMH
jgi:3-oxoacyl-[acyl-carrier protein] reductase